ncbi:MAG TPA: hypothetical protein VGK87_11085, partial [Anaerolineae bacterium]
MSRYTFNPNIDPGRDRNRRLLIGALVIAAILVVGIALFIFGIRSLTGGPAASNANATPTKFVAQVTIFAPEGTFLTTTTPLTTPVVNPIKAPTTTPVGTAVKVTSTVQSNATASVGSADPRGALPGMSDFTCPKPHAAPAAFGYGIQSNWPV